MAAGAVASLLKSSAVTQGKWLDTALYRARLELTAAPIKLPDAVKAHEYTIPGSAQSLWIVPLRDPAPRVQATDAARTSFTRPQRPRINAPHQASTASPTLTLARLPPDTSAPQSGSSTIPATTPLPDNPFERPNRVHNPTNAFVARLQAEAGVADGHPRLPAPYPKPPARACSHSHGARRRAISLEVEANRVPRRYNQPTTPRAWSEYAQRVEEDLKLDAARDEAELRQRFTAAYQRHREGYIQRVAERGAHQWTHVVPLASLASDCEAYRRLTTEYPKWVAGDDTWLDDNAGYAPCYNCAGIAKDKEMLAWLKLEAKVGRLKPDLAATTALDIAGLHDYLHEREAEEREGKQHECPQVLFDRLPEDAVTLLELRIFYGLGNT